MILYIISWTFIYLILILLLHNLYLFFQDNLTTTKNHIYYNNLSNGPNIEKVNSTSTLNNNLNNDLNNDFTYQMKDELNDFIIKMKNEK
jgi:hypothetical protein